MTQYNPNPNGTANVTGYTKDLGTLTATADGLNWAYTGSSTATLTLPAASMTAGTLVLSGWIVRKNSGMANGIYAVNGYGGPGYSFTQKYLGDVAFTTGQFLFMGNFAGQPVTSGQPNPYFTIQIEGPFNVTMRGLNCYDSGSAPVGAAIDADDCAFTYTNASNSLTAAFTHSDPNEEVYQLTWNFGDGTAAVVGGAYRTGNGGPFVTSSAWKVNHTYAQAGNYTVTLTARGAAGSGTTGNVTSSQVVSVPSGTFAADYTYQASYLTVDVDASASTAPSNDPVDGYSWNWGDGTTNGTGKLASHTYAQAGTYSVALTITTNETLRTSTTTKAVVITAPPNTANYFNVSKNLLDVAFTPSIQDGTSYAWTFGDGGTSAVKNATWTYATAGTYSVTLTVSGTQTTTQSVTVTEAYVPLSRLVDNLRLEVAVPPVIGTIYNRLKNPDGAKGAWGWQTPLTNSTVIGSSSSNTPADKGIPGAKLIYSSSGSGTQVMYSTPVTVGAGQYAGAQFVCTYVDGYYRVCVEALNASGAVVGTSAQTGYLSALGTPQRTTGYLLPAGTTKARLRINHYSTTAGATPAAGKILQLRHLMLATAATAAIVDAVPYAEAENWQNVLGSTASINVSREALDVGTLTAEVLDSQLDPAISTTIRPGQGVRLRVNAPGEDGNSVLETIYSGTLNEAKVVYKSAKTGITNKSTKITLSATDNITALAQTGEARGVALITELPEILEGAGVPYEINGSSGQVPTVQVIAMNENSSVLDQVAITRDTSAGYAYVDRHNVLIAKDTQHMPAIAAGVVDESHFSAVDATFNTDECMNSVTIVWLRYDSVTGDTTEIAYGPYEDLASIDAWGLRPATFTMQGLENPTTIAAKAQAILTANSVPERHINSVTVPIRNVEDLTTGKALLDLYDLVQLGYARTETSELARVTGITHSITPNGWLMGLSFSVDGAVAPPQMTPSPPYVAPDVTSTPATLYAATATQSAALVTSTTFTDLPGVTLTVPVTATTQRFLVSVTLDIMAPTSVATNFVGALLVNGTAQTRQFVTNMPLAGMRADATQVWLVTGVAVGSAVFKVQGRITSATTNTYTVNGTHSNITITEV